MQGEIISCVPSDLLPEKLRLDLLAEIEVNT